MSLVIRISGLARVPVDPLRLSSGLRRLAGGMNRGVAADELYMREDHEEAPRYSSNDEERTPIHHVEVFGAAT
jgi:hypothetical protein